jgi:hypothetical protein
MGGNGPDERRGDAERPAVGVAGGDVVAPSRGAGRAVSGVPQCDLPAGLAAEAVEELYGGDLETFTERRKAFIAAARAAGDKPAAAGIAALRKPTRAAWVVNRLARADPGSPARLAAVAAALRDAEQRKDGPRLRELSAERGALIDALTTAALDAAGVPDPPTSLREEVAATLTAALADPATAAEFAAGTLTKAAHWSGFGFGGLDLAPGGDGSHDDDAVFPGDCVSAADGSGPRPTRASGPAKPLQGGPADRSDAAPTPADAPSRQSRGAPARREQPGQSRPSPPARSPRPAGPPDEIAARRAAQELRAAQERQAAEERRAAEEQERLAREAAERAAVRRKNYEDAERSVASAATATAEAESAEERLEAEVLDLEERLIQARADLAKARLRARHAESAERRARQGLDRLPRP